MSSYRYNTVSNTEIGLTRIIGPTTIAGMSMGKWVINDNGNIVTQATPPDGVYGTYVDNLIAGGISANGTIIAADLQFGAVAYIISPTGHKQAVASPQLLGVGPRGINDSGQWIGVGAINGVMSSFVMINGTPQVITAPGSVNNPMASIGGPPVVAMGNSTIVNAINNAGEIVGQFSSNDSHNHGFLYRDGQYTRIDVPGATDTIITGLDNQGNLVGNYTDSNGNISTFWGTDGQYGGFGNPIAPFDRYLVSDQTTGQTSTQVGDDYSGPVGSLTSQFISISKDNLNITGTAPNEFIHTGSGEDAIDVSHAGGSNILDGSTGSNFLVGGAGNDTFFADDRGPSSDIWSTIVGFHSGDVATIFGIREQDFSISRLDAMGADGFKGLTFEFTKAGSPNALVTFAGYSQADLSHLSVSFGNTSDLPGLPGAAFMQITGA